MPPHPRKKTNSKDSSASATPAANVTDKSQATEENAVLAIGLDTLVLDQVAEVCVELHASLTHFNTPNQAPESVEHAALALCQIQHFQELHEKYPQLPVIVIASVADSRLTIEAMKRGAIECLVTPIQPDILHEHMSEALQSAADMVAHPRGRMTIQGADDGIIGQSPAMLNVYKLLGLIAPRQVNVLLTGESGTGKEIIAQAIHKHSRRADKPFLAINCAAIPETLLEDELFGHEKGAFTGADHQREGKFEQADGGTLLLDEIGDMPLATQVKLLRVLQNHNFTRLGGSKIINCDVRIIAATHQPLEQLIETKRFRQDLYYRLKVATIHLPPLRQREVDAVLMAHYFVDELNNSFGTHISKFSPDAIATILSYDWPGNVRELENAIKASLLVARGTVFKAEFLPEHIRLARPQSTNADTPAAASPTTNDGQLQQLITQTLSDTNKHGEVRQSIIDTVDKLLIVEALNQSHGQLQQTAKLLGISRTTLRQRMNKLGISLTVSATP
ncbi:MAG: sigma 54-interacting transcriptional regulator [Phycisphaeraceae bacterium JB051]